MMRWDFICKSDTQVRTSAYADRLNSHAQVKDTKHYIYYLNLRNSLEHVLSKEIC